MYKVAQAYAVLGDKDSALRVFQNSIAGGFFCYDYFAHDPLLDILRVSPEFARIAAQARERQQQFRERFSPLS
jgi:hypothetical protein